MNVTINNTEVGASPSELIEIQPGDVYPIACIAEGDATSEAVVRVCVPSITLCETKADLTPNRNVHPSS